MFFQHAPQKNFLPTQPFRSIPPFLPGGKGGGVAWIPCSKECSKTPMCHDTLSLILTETQVTQQSWVGDTSAVGDHNFYMINTNLDVQCIGRTGHFSDSDGVAEHQSQLHSQVHFVACRPYATSPLFYRPTRYPSIHNTVHWTSRRIPAVFHKSPHIWQYHGPNPNKDMYLDQKTHILRVLIFCHVTYYWHVGNMHSWLENAL